MLWRDNLERVQVRLHPRSYVNSRRYIEKDAALARRFQPVMINEPTVEDTISILRGLKERYEGMVLVSQTNDSSSRRENYGRSSSVCSSLLESLHHRS